MLAPWLIQTRMEEGSVHTDVTAVAAITKRNALMFSSNEGDRGGQATHRLLECVSDPNPYL